MPEMHRHEPTDTITAALAALGARYHVECEIGRGGMAVVHLARERVSGRRVAIKLISARYSTDADAVRRFAREARTAIALQHPNIVRTLAIEELDAGDTLAIVSAYVPGSTLRDALRTAGPFSFDRAAAVLRDVAAALDHAHGMRIVHRDVKPENVFLVGDPGRALLTDFGIARELDGDTLLTVEGSSVGTPTYMSPEQVDGRPVDGRADVYALGLVGWEMLAGERPWQGETLYSVLHKQKHEQLPALAGLRPDIPAYLLAAIEGAIEKDPDRRWPSASEMLRRLTPAPARPRRRAAAAGAAGGDGGDGGDGGETGETGELPTAATVRLPQTSSARRPRIRVRRGWAAAAALVVAAAALLLALTGRGGDAPAAAATPDTTLSSDLARARQATRSDVASDTATVPPPPPVEQGVAGERAGPGTPGTPPRGRSAAGEVALPPRALSARCASPGPADQRACLLALIARQDVALDRTYQALITEMRRDAGGTREPPSVQALRAEQRGWLAARDGACRAEGDIERGGTWAVLLAPCFERQSAVREAELRRRLGRLRAG